MSARPAGNPLGLRKLLPRHTSDTVIRVRSRHNPHIKHLRALAGSARERRHHQQTILDGPHLLRAYLDSGARPRSIVVTEPACENAEIRALLKRLQGVDTIYVPDDVLRVVTPVESPVGIVAHIDLPPAIADPASCECLVLLDRVQDPGNVGAILRSAAAAGVQGALLSAGCADPWSPRALRAGMGAQFVLGIGVNVPLAEFATGYRGCIVAATHRGGRVPAAVDLTGRIALLLGGEGEGIDPVLLSTAQLKVTIPMAPAVESLNVGAAAAVILFERVRQLGVRVRRS